MQRVGARMAVALALLAVGSGLLSLARYEKRGYLDLVAAGVRATEERRFDSRHFELAERNAFASPALLAYDRGVRANAAGDPALAARHFREAISRGADAALRAKAYYNLGTLFALSGEARVAGEMLREALRLDPWDWDAKSNLEALYARVRASDEEGGRASLKQAPGPGEAGARSGGAPGSPKAGI